MDVEQSVAQHYSNPQLEQTILERLVQLGRDPDRLEPADLAAVDEFHIGGSDASRDIAVAVGMGPNSHVLDLGSGLGGPARLFAHEFGASVQGVDLTEGFVEAARSLTRRTGLSERVRFSTGSILELGNELGRFDAATLLHVGMNIADKAALFREVHRVLRPGGVFAIYDIMTVDRGAPAYPLPWAGVPEVSFVDSPQEYRRLLDAAGFERRSERNRLEFGLQSMAAMQAKAAEQSAPALSLQVVMGPEGSLRMRNLLAAFRQGTLAPVEILSRRV